ncbi:MAG: ribosome small subunit-dependent GTPase A [Lachnospiraceae bacterium]|nr:ribosome small subunit-dependent GTPase A [Lachnospiraceae bacterium]
MHGRIIKGVGGFYYVHTDRGIYTCHAKGLLRLDGRRPLVGDIVDIDIVPDEEMVANISGIHERKNTLIRPNVANVDQTLIIFSLVRPEPNFVTCDKMILQYLTQDIEVLLCFNKEDLADDNLAESVADDYRNCGCRLFVTSAKEKEGITELSQALTGRTTVVSGPSGVGKSSLINCLTGNDSAATGEISEKLARGKHTTRHSEIIPIMENTYIIDTPGFGSFDLFDIKPEDLTDYYEEFRDAAACRFMPCSHTHEPGCAIKEAVAAGSISKRRYDNYVYIYDELNRMRRH